MNELSAFAQGTDEEKQRAAEALVAVMEAVRVVAVMLLPVTPSLSKRIYSQLGFSDEAFESLTWEDTKWGGIPQGHQVPKPKPVFARLEGDFVTEAAGVKEVA